ncbi:MAG: iron chelate uptake ABC transporter family permease subunit, partial [Pseudomonadota bacterium]
MSRVLILVLSLLVTGLFVLSLLVGPAGFGPGLAMTSLLLGAGGPAGGVGEDTTREAAAIVMREIRLPRAILGAMIGATLGLSGAALQGYLRNPLAEPGLIGVSATA